MNKEENYKHSEITGKIIKSFYSVYNKLGYGFLEKVYENALVLELKKSGLNCIKQQSIEVFYDEQKEPHRLPIFQSLQV